MRYVKDSPLELGFRVWQLRPPTPSLTVVVKGTFDAAAGSPAPFAAEQVPATGEMYWDDDVEQSLRAPSDFPLLKPRGECFVVGKAWATGGRPVSSLTCDLTIGPISKSFVVFGDRAWGKGLVRGISEPVPFTEMELRMERAYGGRGYAPNPYGRGRDEVEGAIPLPNLEHPRELINAPSSRPEPVIVGPLPVTWPERMRYAGTYDAVYMKERWPWLPRDFDWRFFLEAPRDQQLKEGFWRGDERIQLTHLHPTVPIVQSRLPAIAPRVFIDIDRGGAATSFEEVPLKLDTVTWDASIGKLLLTWHGIAEVLTERLDEVKHLFVAHDPLAGPFRSVRDLKARFEAKLAEEEGEEKEAEGEEPPAVTTGGAAEEATPDAPAGAASDEEASADAAPDSSPEPSPEEKELEEKMAGLDAQLAAMGAKPPEPPADAPPPKPPDPKAMLESMRAAGIEVTPELEQMVAELAEPPPEPAVEEPQPEPEPESPPVVDGRALVEARIAAGEPLTELDLTGADLSGMDLSGRDLSGSILARANLAGVKLGKAVLRGCSAPESDLLRAELAGADLTGADFTRANLQWVDFLGATLEDATFEEARMIQVRLAQAKAARAIFVRADLTESVLAQGDFAEADFERATLLRVDASEAKLSDATLEDAHAEGARFDRALMTKARAAGLRANEARFGAIDAEDSFWERSQLSRANFAFARLTRADFSDAVVIGAEMDGCAMRGARFDRANAHSLRARKSDLMEASFESADLSFADLRGANLFGAELYRAKTLHTELELANVTRTKLER